MKIKAFILAAGLGTRLRPITNFIPKPLLPLAGKPIVEYVLENLQKLAPQNIGINLHHKPRKLLNWLKTSSYSSRIQIFYEKEILGTGGALKNAYAFLKDSLFLVHNADIFHSFNLREVLDFHLNKKPLATLVVKDIPWANKLFIDKKNRLIGIDPISVPKGCYRKLGFTGVAIYDPQFLDFLPSGFCSVVEGWLKALEQGKTILTYAVKEEWFDVGTPLSYFKTLVHILKLQGETVYFHPQAETDFLDFQGYVSVETPLKFLPGSYLENTIVLSYQGNFSEKLKNGIVGKNFFIPLEKEPILEPCAEGIPIGYGGSDRRFFRIFFFRQNQQKMESYIKMKFLTVDEDFNRTIAYNQFFRTHKIPVPKIYHSDPKRGEIIFEDLGDVSLYTWLKGKRSSKLIRKMYQRVIKNLVKLHSIESKEINIPFRVFDYEHFRWETRYFEQMFLDFLCQFEKIEERLYQEFHILAETCDKFSKNLIHRDFQSQNIMIKDNRVFFIDYQGARIGPPGYDVVSLLWDPYVEIDQSIREDLLYFYLELRQKKDRYFEASAFLRSLPFLKLQRHLQALAAYINLSFFKGKKHFLKFIPNVLRYLKEDLSSVEFEILKKYIWIGFQRVDKILTVSYL